MPKQRRRKERERRENERRRRREAEGRWEVVFETTDPDEMRAHRDGSDAELRVEVLCGRLRQPTWYRISRLVPR
ncbi:hypothetical protein [Nocardiopsis ganjiahuensis]|uniref:hypothetical protein n=1 Tax=Nocardiopsis ganjiahuensis TaxID=239984 RepID=UPI00034598A1|nr:hypothetical protein [Nocardiopsis ganjiahuensis]